MSSLRWSFWSLAAIFCSPGCDIDGGFSIDSEVTFDGLGDLSYAPVFVQGFSPQDINSDGRPRTDAVPLYQLLASGAMDEESSVPLRYGSLGYPSEAEFIADLGSPGLSAPLAPAV